MHRAGLFLLVGTTLAAAPAWVEKSNRNAQPLLEIEARYNPEAAGQSGVSGVDEWITDLTARSGARQLAELWRAEKLLAAPLASESDPLEQLDRECLCTEARQDIRGREVRDS